MPPLSIFHIGVLLGLGSPLYIFLGTLYTIHGSQDLFSVCPVGAASVKRFSNLPVCSCLTSFSIFLCEFRFSFIPTSTETFAVRTAKRKIRSMLAVLAHVLTSTVATHLRSGRLDVARADIPALRNEMKGKWGRFGRRYKYQFTDDCHIPGKEVRNHLVTSD